MVLPQVAQTILDLGSGADRALGSMAGLQVLPKGLIQRMLSQQMPEG